MTWITLHQQSEVAASRAQELAQSGQRDQAVRAYADAAVLEEQALDAVEADKPRTVGILAVSAASLWFKAKELRRAETLTLRAMSWTHLPAFAAQDLRVVLQSIWTEDAKQQAGVSFLPGQVLVSVKGGDVVVGGNGFVEIGTREHAAGAEGWFCGECMNSSVFRTRNIVPRDGSCECCGRSDNGKVWELGGITERPHSPTKAEG